MGTSQQMNNRKSLLGFIFYRDIALQSCSRHLKGRASTFVSEKGETTLKESLRERSVFYSVFQLAIKVASRCRYET